MKRNISNKIILLFTCVVLFGCKTKKLAAVSAPKNEMDSKAGWATIIAHQTDFSFFATRASTHLAINDKNYDVTLNIRIKKGEMIWVSVTAVAGIEVARAMITPDSVKVMDRINNEYLKKSFDLIHEFANEKIDYSTLEALLIGNCVPFALNQDNELNVSAGAVNLKGKEGDLSYQLLFNAPYKPIQSELTDLVAHQSLKVENSIYQEVLNQLIPTKVMIDSKAGVKLVRVAMDYSKIQLNEPLDFPFNVPKRFSVID